MSLPYPGIPGYPYYPSPVLCLAVPRWPVPVVVIVCVIAITLAGWTPPEVLRLLALLHAAG